MYSSIYITYITSQTYIYIHYRRKFRSQTSDNMDENQRWEESEKRREEERESLRRKKIQVREKVGSRETLFFQWFVAPEGRQVGSLKRRVRSHLARWEIKNCTPLWREAHFEVKMYKTPQLRTTSRSCGVEKVHAVVARSTFRSQNVQNTSAPDHFSKLRCRKSARRCGAKHISKSKCTKHLSSRPLLEVAVSKKSRCCGAKHISKSKCTKHLSSGPLFEVAVPKKCTPLWREAHFEVKMYNFGSCDVEKVQAVVARSKFPSQNVQNATAPDHFWKLRCRKSARRCGAKYNSKSKCENHDIRATFGRWDVVSRGRAQGIAHLVKSEQNVRFLWHFQKRWQAWDILRGSAKMHFAWQAQYKRHVHQRC